MSLQTKSSFTLASLFVSLTFLLSACGPSATVAPTIDINAIYTQAAVTIVAGLTQTSVAMPSSTLPPPTSSPSPSPTIIPTIEILMTPTPLAQIYPTSAIPTVDPATARGCYNATLIADVTILYAPKFDPGDKFTKTWRIKNTGSCDWPRDFQLVFTSGDRFGADTIAIDQRVLAGQVTEISLAMTAPALVGVVNSNWQVATAIGKPFGSVLSATITLPTNAGSTPGSGGCLNSALVADVTIPSGTILKAGESFTKTWLIKNTGTCTWNNNFKIFFVGGDLLGSDTTKIRQKVGPGSSAQISLEMTAPGTKGTVSSSWQMASEAGTLFGQLFYFSIDVK